MFSKSLTIRLQRVVLVLRFLSSRRYTVTEFLYRKLFFFLLELLNQVSAERPSRCPCTFTNSWMACSIGSFSFPWSRHVHEGARVTPKIQQWPWYRLKHGFLCGARYNISATTRPHLCNHLGGRGTLKGNGTTSSSPRKPLDPFNATTLGDAATRLGGPESQSRGPPQQDGAVTAGRPFCVLFDRRRGRYE